MPDRSKIFSECGKVLLRIHAAENQDPKEFVSTVREARLSTLAILREVAENCEALTEAGISSHVLSVLSDLHPETDYVISGQSGKVLIAEKLVRDLAEICATFHSIELSIERSSRERFLEAKLFCDHMADELKQLDV